MGLGLPPMQPTEGQHDSGSMGEVYGGQSRMVAEEERSSPAGLEIDVDEECQ